MQSVRKSRFPGAGFVGLGAAFLALSSLAGLKPFLGAGLAFISLGIVFIARSRQ